MNLFFHRQKKAAKVEENTFSDDEIPANVDLQDLYFAEEELSKQGKHEKGMI